MSDHVNRDQLTNAFVADAQALLNYFERRVGIQEAPDLLAEVMATAWRRITVLPRDTEQARMWLFGIARNVLSDHARGERRRWRLADRVRSLTTAADVTTSAIDTHSEVQDAVSRLPDDLAELVRLVHWDGFTIAEAAELTGVTASTARGRYQRARAQLRVALFPEEVRQTAQ